MSPSHDLSVLARPASPVPRPPRRWKSRVLLPLVVFAMAGGLLFKSARDLLEPRVKVRVASVVPVPAEARDGGVDRSGGGPDHPPVQAPGWIEPAPFAITVPALADGVE